MRPYYMYSSLQRVRLLRRPVGANFRSRYFHDAKARFTTLDGKGTPVSSEIEIMAGDPGEPYIYIKPEIGNAIRSAVARGAALEPLAKLETIPLYFDHKSRHFAHHSLSYPRVQIDHDLPGPSKSDEDTSPATLWLSGLLHAITLDNTSEALFEKLTRESAQTLAGVLEALKNS